MREDLLKSLSSLKDVTNIIVLTQNIDFVFIQSIVLAAIKKCGNPKLTIFADSNCAMSTFSNQAPVLSYLGMRYRVIPVEFTHPFHFHPKAILASSLDKAVLNVGSGNLTFGGWRENAEAWVKFDTEKDGNGPFKAFYDYLKEILEHVSLNESIKIEIEEAYDPNLRKWAVNLGNPSNLIGKMRKGKALIDKMSESIDLTKTIDRITICSPYYDEKGEAILKLMKKFNPRQVDIFIQNGMSTLYTYAKNKLPKNVRLHPVEFRKIKEYSTEHRRFIHAKFYAIEQNKNIILFLGSANCSNAALTIPGESGNAELVAVQRMSLQKFQEIYLNELDILEGEVILQKPKENDDPPETDIHTIRLQAARYDDQQLTIAYVSDTDLCIKKAVIDDVNYDLKIIQEGIAEVTVVNLTSRSFYIEGTLNGQSIRSNSLWIDYEKELRTTARSHSFTDIVRDKVRKDHWDIGAWTGIMDFFYKNMQYAPPIISRRLHNQSNITDQKVAVEYTADDVFSSNYNLPYNRSVAISLDEENRISSLQQLFLRWFGIAKLDPVEETPVNNEDDENDEEDTVDKPEHIPFKKKSIIKKDVTEKEKAKAQKIMNMIVATITSEDYLSKREPELIAQDLRLVSILLRSGMGEKWITENEFFDMTHEIWVPLFFSKRYSNHGWIEYRASSEEFPDDFVSKMKSAKLSASIIAWVLGLPEGYNTLEKIRLYLACILSFARLPWLWQGDDINQVAKELKPMLELTTNRRQEYDQKEWGTINAKWQSIIRAGEALRQFESAMNERDEEYTPLSIKDRIKIVEVKKGEILWQGTSGFCILLMDCHRSSNMDMEARVFKLQGKIGETGFKPTDLIIPLRAILMNYELLPVKTLAERPRKELLSILDKLSADINTIDLGKSR